MKEIAYEKMGVNLLRQDHQQRVVASDAKMQKLLSEKRHIEERMKTSQNNHNRYNALKYQLFINQSKLSHERDTNSIMRREFAIFKRLSK